MPRLGIQHVHMKTRKWQALGAALFVSLFGALAHADFVVPAGGAIALNGGSTDLGCDDLVVAGAFSVSNGNVVGVRNIILQPGGSIEVTNGSITLSGDWTNAGSFAAGTGVVSFVEVPGCAPNGGTISGNNTFARLTFTTVSGRIYRITSGSTQTITQQLTIQGQPDAPLVLRGTTAGQPATITLLGSQQIANFGAADLASGGVWLAPYQVNAINGTGLVRMFGDPSIAVPTLSTWALLLLALSLMWVSRRRLRELTR